MDKPLSEAQVGCMERVAERMIARSLRNIVEERDRVAATSGTLPSGMTSLDVALITVSDELDPPKPTPAKAMFTLTPTGEHRKAGRYEFWLSAAGKACQGTYNNAEQTLEPHRILRLDRVDQETET